MSDRPPKYTLDHESYDRKMSNVRKKLRDDGGLVSEMSVRDTVAMHILIKKIRYTTDDDALERSFALADKFIKKSQE